MSASQQVPSDHPLMIAWEEYKQTEEYVNSFRWAEKSDHRSGSMWAAFETGWRAATKHQGELMERMSLAPSALLSHALAPDRGIFVLNVAQYPSPEMVRNIHKCWDGAWTRTGEDKAPSLLVLEPGMDLQPIGDAELRDMGLMRIPPTSIEGPT